MGLLAAAPRVCGNFGRLFLPRGRKCCRYRSSKYGYTTSVMLFQFRDLDCQFGETRE